MKKLITTAVLLPSLCFMLGGCYDSKEISKTAFVMAIGFDMSDEGEKIYTFQTANPSAYEEGSDEPPVSSSSVKAKTLFAAMDEINSNIPKKLDCSHIKLAVFSKDYLKRGIKSEINAMLNTPSFHPNTRVAMSDGEASEYLNNVQIPPDTNPAEYYENIFKNDYTSIIPDVRLRDMVNKYDVSVCSVVLPIISADETKGSMAILKDFYLGALAEPDELQSYKLLTKNDFEGNFYIKIPNTDKYVVTELTQNKKKIKVAFEDKTPVVSVDIELEGSVLWSESKESLFADDASLESLTQQQIRDSLYKFLNKCSKDYKADILNISSFARKNYQTIKAWHSEDWQGLFEKSTYKVNVRVKIKREGVTI